MIDETQMTLATDMKWQWVEGWFASEKLNGCRAYWDGSQFWTRGGNIVDAPKWFTRGLPNVPLDGEIWAGRAGAFGGESFKVASVAVRFGGDWFKKVSTSGHPIQFAAFDFPSVETTWDVRIELARKALKRASHAVAIPFHKVQGSKHWVDFLKYVLRLGGEGAMFRQPDVKSYEVGRSENLLRLKFRE